MIVRTDDPIADFNKWDAEQERHLNSLPLCDKCQEPIQDEICYEVCGDILCEDCMKDHYARWTEDFTKG